MTSADTRVNSGYNTKTVLQNLTGGEFPTTNKLLSSLDNHGHGRSVGSACSDVPGEIIGMDPKDATVAICG